MPTSVRVDEETEALLERASQAASTTKSDLIRKALRAYCTRIVLSKAMTPYEAIRDFIGCAEGPPNLSRRSRQYLREILRGQKRRRAR